MTRRGREVTVGLFTLGALVALVALTLNLSRVDWFAPKYRLSLHFRDASGLTVGGPVAVHGVNVGTVRAMVYEPVELGGFTYFVRVDVDMRSDVAIYEDGSARCVTAGLVGETKIAMRAGTPGKRQLVAGDNLFGSTSPAFEEELDRLPAMMDDTQAILRGMRELVASPEMARDIKQSVENMRAVTERADKMSLRLEADFDATLNELRQVAADARQTMATVDRELTSASGDARATMASVRERLDEWSVDVDPALADARASLASLREIMDSSRKVLGSEGSDLATFVSKMASSAERLDNLLMRVSEGQGTLGRVVNDAALYDSVSDSARAVRNALGGGGESAFPAVERRKVAPAP